MEGVRRAAQRIWWLAARAVQGSGFKMDKGAGLIDAYAAAVHLGARAGNRGELVHA
jgi:hypothetical protein